MNKKTFETTKALFEKAKYHIAKAEYSDQLSGSWWIVSSVNGRLIRVVWNSRDRWMVFQLATEEMENNQQVWKDMWTSKRNDDFTAKNVFLRFRKIYRSLLKK